MTYEELVKNILNKMEAEMFNDTWGAYATGDSSLSRALFRVVELHNCSNKYCGNCGMASPCLTIQAIKKELE
jgi:hypothetical protein